MNKKIGLLLAILVISTCTSCHSTFTNVPTVKNTSSLNSSHSYELKNSSGNSLQASSSSSSVSKLLQNKDILTTSEYKVNDQIAIGNNADIITKQGVFKQGLPSFKGKSFYDKDVDFLGMDSNNNFIIDDYQNGVIDSVDSSNKVTLLLNYMGNRKNHVYAMSMCGNIVAWSECPHGDEDPAADPTNGAGWALYYANLKTKQITKVDEYKKISVPNNAQYHYLPPSEIAVTSDHLAYVSWDYAKDGSVKPTIKLYTMATKLLETVDCLSENVANHALGYPSISGDKMVWCEAQVNSDGTYTGYSIFYDLKTKVKSKLVTSENIINPIISGNYVFASGQPNKTFYDWEICIYDIVKNQWVYKINNNYSQYQKIKNDNLSNLQSAGGYLVWDTTFDNALVIFNKADNKLYNIVPDSQKRYITDTRLLNGNLLVWYDRPFSSNGAGVGEYKYVVLK